MNTMLALMLPRSGSGQALRCNVRVCLWNSPLFDCWRASSSPRVSIARGIGYPCPLWILASPELKVSWQSSRTMTSRPPCSSHCKVSSAFIPRAGLLRVFPSRSRMYRAQNWNISRRELITYPVCSTLRVTMWSVSPLTLSKNTFNKEIGHPYGGGLSVFINSATVPRCVATRIDGRRNEGARSV